MLVLSRKIDLRPFGRMRATAVEQYGWDALFDRDFEREAETRHRRDFEPNPTLDR
jgi:hypothetical protein